MNKSIEQDNKHPSLENLIISENLGIETLHPGGLDITTELAELCNIAKGIKVLDVASGTGESIIYLVNKFDCVGNGIDNSSYMIERSKNKVKDKNIDVKFTIGDTHNLPFEDNYFDVVICECTMCIFNKEKAIDEMLRVVKPRGYIGIHDICWKKDTPQYLKTKLMEIEGEIPETLDEWKSIFSRAGLKNIKAIDKSYIIPSWIKNNKKEIGIKGQFKIFKKVFSKWGFRGIKNIIDTEKIFKSKFTGYGIIIGNKTNN